MFRLGQLKCPEPEWEISLRKRLEIGRDHQHSMSRLQPLRAAVARQAAAVLGETLDQVLAEPRELSPGLEPAEQRWNTDRGAEQDPAGDLV